VAILFHAWFVGTPLDILMT